jgi:hypothetical protein
VIDTQAEDTTFHQFETQRAAVPDDDDDAFGVPPPLYLLCLHILMIMRLGVPVVLPLLPLLPLTCSCCDPRDSYSAAGSLGSRAGPSGSGPAADVRENALDVSDDSGQALYSKAAASPGPG